MKKNFKKINIGIVCSPWLGGSGVVGSELAKYLFKTERYKVVFIGSELPFRIDKNEVIFRKVEMLNHALFSSPLNEVALVEGIVEAVIEQKLDIIHAHFAIPFAYCALQAREILKKMGINIKIVTTLHGTDVLTLGKDIPATMKYVLEQSDSVTAVSKDLAMLAKKIYHTRRQIQVVYNFIDQKPNQENFTNLSLRRKFAKPEKKIFVHISNFRPIKRVGDSLKVFSKISKKIPSVLLLIGEGPEIKVAKKLAKSLKSKDSIYFIGKVKNPYEYLKIADGLIITSEYESFCLVGLEAMTYGVPVFSTNVGGISEVIKHQKSGYLADLGDIDSMSKYIIEHYSHEETVAKVKKQAQTISQDFSAEKVIPQYELIYKNILSSKHYSIPNISKYK